MAQSEWDPVKAASNLRKHGVSFDEALTSFSDPHGIVVDDLDSTESEDRLVRLAYSSRGRLLVVVYMLRRGMIRVITARKANWREREDYES